MRYTRYEYKKSGKLKFITSVAVIAGISITVGLYGSKLIFNGMGDKSNNTPNYSKQEVVQSGGKKVIAIQCGYYANESNAQSALSLIPSDYTSFIVKEEDKYRLIAGVYDYDEGKSKIDDLSNKGVANTKIEFEIPEDTKENKSILEIIDGFLKITSKLNDSTIKSIKTSDYKAWSKNIVSENQIEDNEVLTEINNYIDNIPDEIDKQNCKESLISTYELIKKYRIVR